MLIYILSRHPNSYSTSRLAKVIVSRGHNVRIIDHLQCELRIGRKSHIYYQDEELEKPDYIVPRIGASATFKGSNVVRQFEMMKVKTLVTADGLLSSRDKLRSSQNLVFHDIEVPKTYFPSSFQTNLRFMAEQVGGLPIIIKLIEGTQGIGVSLAHDFRTAKQVITEHNKFKKKYLIQEFVKESSGQDIRVLVVGGKAVSAMKRIAPEGEFRSNIHRGGRGEKVILTKAEEYIAIKTAKVMNLSVAGVDILQSNKGPLVLEVNSSPGLEGIEKYTGINIAEKIVEFMENSLTSIKN